MTRASDRRGPRGLQVWSIAVITAVAGVHAADAAVEDVRFTRGAVVCVEAAAAEAGAETLRLGGSAADAAVATALALAVVHPQAGNLTGGHFSLWRGAGGDVEVIDGRETAPGRVREDLFRGSDGEPDPQLALRSALAAGVPGSVPALALLHRRHGRLPWSVLVEPARRLAADGFVVSPTLVAALRRHQQHLAADPDAAAIFLPRGQVPAAGQTLRQPELAATLRRLQDEGPQTMTTGHVARQLAADMERRGGLVTLADLAAYRPVVRRPLHGWYRGYRILVPPPPSAGGVIVLQALQTLRLYSIAPADGGTGRLAHLMAEVSRRAFADRHHWLGDPDFVDVPLRDLLSPQRAAAWGRELSLQHASASAPLFGALADRPAAVTTEGEQTTHASVIDRWGNAVAHTTTLNTSFGSGLVARGTGLLWNNEMDDFAAAPGVANVYGIPGAPRNAMAGGKRPLSSMTPTMVEHNGRLRYVFGSPGGATIPSTVTQVLSGLIDLHLPPAAAVSAPRIHHQGLPDRLTVEPDAAPSAVRDALVAMGHVVEQRSAPQGDAHLLAVAADGTIIAAPDPRRGGAARGH